MKNTIIGLFIILLVGTGLFFLVKTQTKQVFVNTSVVHVVAAENFYGDIAKQLGGSHVQVTSLLSDPNADPHEYESNVQDGVAVATADIIIENGLSYDTWMDKLLSASPNNRRIVLIAGKIATNPLADNPHVWYGVDNVKAIAKQIVVSLKKVDPKDVRFFDANLITFDASLQPLEQKITNIKAKYQGTPVALTETIYLYQSQPEGLQVLTPFEFERAIAEGNDPAASDVQTANNQLTGKQAKILIFNSQTITPITTNMQNEAKQLHIPVVPVSETMPQSKHYQSWMLDQLTNLEQSLQKALQ